MTLPVSGRTPARVVLAGATLLLGLGLLTACDDAPPVVPPGPSTNQESSGSGTGGEDRHRSGDPGHAGGGSEPTRPQPRPTTTTARPTTRSEYPPSNCPAGLVC